VASAVVARLARRKIRPIAGVQCPREVSHGLPRSKEVLAREVLQVPGGGVAMSSDTDREVEGVQTAASAEDHRVYHCPVLTRGGRGAPAVVGAAIKCVR